MKRGLLFTLSIWLVGATMIRGTLLMPHHCPVVTEAAALFAARESASWIERAQAPDGTYVYEYNRAENLEPGGYNVVRHAGVTMSLYQLAVGGDLSVLPAADRGMDYMIDNLYQHDGWAAFQNPDDGGVQLGASALMLAGLMQRRIATGDDRYDTLSKQVARGMLALQLPDGAFLNRWDPRTESPVPDQRSKYATGEAFWGLTLMHRFFPGEGWDTAALKTADYLALARDDYEQQKFPPWADQWAAYGLGEMAGWPPAEHHITYARSLAERFGFLVRVESQRRDNWFSKMLHGRQARAAGMGTWVEGLTSLHHLAATDPRMADMEAKLAERVECGAGMLADRQVSESEAAPADNPARSRGAWFTNDITRMDDQQHALSGLLYAAPIIANREDTVTDFVQLLVFFIAAVNPAAAAAAPSPPGTKLAPSMVATGLGAAVVLVCGAALLSNPILDGLGVEPETFRVGAGVVFLVCGALGAWNGGAAHRGPWDGALAGIFPLALPVLATPAALAAAVTYGADRGEGETVAVAAIVLLVAAALVYLRIGKHEAATDGVARITGGLLAVVAAGLIVSGVRAI